MMVTPRRMNRGRKTAYPGGTGPANHPLDLFPPLYVYAQPDFVGQDSFSHPFGKPAHVEQGTRPDDLLDARPAAGGRADASRAQGAVAAAGPHLPHPRPGGG